MIDVFSWATPNGHKIHIMLEETNLPYQIHGINIGEGDQFTDAFLKISPNNKIPAIVDHDGPNQQPISLFESGAILIYLAEKTGKFLPQEPLARFQTLQWLMFQMASLGPMLGQAHHFRTYTPEKITYAIDRYTKEAYRLYSVMDKQLSKNHYLAGEAYTIADIACFPWTRSWEKQGIILSDYPHVHQWHQEIAQRPAVIKGVSVLADLRTPLTGKKAQEILFGQKKH